MDTALLLWEVRISACERGAGLRLGGSMREGVPEVSLPIFPPPCLLTDDCYAEAEMCGGTETRAQGIVNFDVFRRYGMEASCC